MATLSGCRILVAEDEQLIAMMIEDILSGEGCVVVGPFDRLDATLTSATTDNLDGALLDVKLHGAEVYPVAEALAARGIPFILLSGLGDLAVPPEHPDWSVCGKPFTPGGLVEVLLTHFRPGPLAEATSRVDPRGDASGT